MRGTSTLFVAALVICFLAGMSTAGAGDDFFLLDNGLDGAVDGFYRSNTDDVSGDVLVRQFEADNWGDLSPSDVPFHLFAARPAFGTGPGSAIVRIRESDGEIVSAIMPDQAFQTIAYDVAGLVLYGAGISTVDSRLFTVDLDTGESVVVGDTNIPGAISSLVHDPVTALLFASDSYGDLYAVDPGSAAATLIGPTGLDRPFGLAWNPSDDLLYATDETTDSLYTIDRVDASATLVGGPYSQATFANGLCFSNVPEPTSVLLLVLAGLSAVSLKHRRGVDKPRCS